MRRRWKVNAPFFQGLAICWALVGGMAVVVVGLVYRTHDRHGDQGAAWVHSPIHWLLPHWLAPFVAFVAFWTVVGIKRGLVALWRHPPIRRVIEPVSEDLREVKR